MPVSLKCEGVVGGDEVLPLLFGQRSLGRHNPPEGMPSSPVEGAEPPSMTTVLTATSQEQAVMETLQEPVKERKCPKFPRWEKVLHLSQPVVVAGQPPCPSRSPEQTYPLVANCNQPANIVPPELTSPPQELEVAH